MQGERHPARKQAAALPAVQRQRRGEGRRRADARPVSTAVMLAYVAACIGTNANAIAMPRENMIARMVHRLVSSETKARGSVNTAMASMPNTISRRGPTT